MPTSSYTDATFSVSAIGARTDSSGVAVSDFTAEDARLLASILTEGYLTDGAFAVAESDTPAMTVKVGTGVAKADLYVVAGDTAGQGNYIVRLDSAGQTVTVPAADASQTRTDEVYLIVRDNTYDASSLSLPRIGYRKGDLGGAAPGADAGWEAYALLATIAVAAAATEIVTANITDERGASGLLDGLIAPGGDFTVPGNLTVTGDVSVGDDVTLADDVALASGSVLTWNAESANFYRSTTNTLKTDGALVVGTDLTVLDDVVITGDLTASGVDIVDAVNDALDSGSRGYVGTQQTTTSTSYTNLATTGPSCTVVLSETRYVLVLVCGELFQSGSADRVYMSFQATGATSFGPEDSSAAVHNGTGSFERFAAWEVMQCNAGTTTFTAKYKVASGTGRYAFRHITAFPIFTS